MLIKRCKIIGKKKKKKNILFSLFIPKEKEEKDEIQDRHSTLRLPHRVQRETKLPFSAALRSIVI